MTRVSIYAWALEEDSLFGPQSREPSVDAYVSEEAFREAFGVVEAEPGRMVEAAASQYVVWVEVVVEHHVLVEELYASPLVVAAAAFETQVEDDAGEDPNVVILATTFLGHLEVAEEEDRCVEGEEEGYCEGEEEEGLQYSLNHSLNGMDPILPLPTCRCQSHCQNPSYLGFGTDPNSTRQSPHRSPTWTWPRYLGLGSHSTKSGKPEPGSGREQRGLMLKRSRLQSC